MYYKEKKDRLHIYAESADGDDADSMRDAFDHMLENSELQHIDPADTGIDLTSAPMFGLLGDTVAVTPGRNGFVLSGSWDGKHFSQPILKRWAWMRYEISDMFEELAVTKHISLLGGAMWSQREARWFEAVEKCARERVFSDDQVRGVLIACQSHRATLRALMGEMERRSRTLSGDPVFAVSPLHAEDWEHLNDKFREIFIADDDV